MCGEKWKNLEKVVLSRKNRLCEEPEEVVGWILSTPIGRADRVPLLAALHLPTGCRQPELSHSGSVYTTEMGRHHLSGLFAPEQPVDEHSPTHSCAEVIKSMLVCWKLPEGLPFPVNSEIG